jgi:sulfate adenylyltransferase
MHFCKTLVIVSLFASRCLAEATHAITLTTRQLCDLELIMSDGFAPLQGFMKQADYDEVVTNMRLADGTLWPMPITLDVSEQVASGMHQDDTLALKSADGDLLATMQVEELWAPDKGREAQLVYGSTDLLHPGVEYLMNQVNPVYVGGRVTKVAMPKHYDFTDLRKTPTQLKQYFKDNNINRVVAFQTRNPMHRAHQELTFRAAKQANAHLLIQPVVGLTKPGDVDYFTRVRCYKKLLRYYPEGSATLALLPLAMRMAGPREALWHAIIRKNHGCTHFIVGRDHAGPGKNSKGEPFYGPYEAQELVAQYAGELGITMLPFSEMVYVPETDSYHPVDEIPAGTKTMTLSGTQLRDILRDGTEIPAWFTYPEVAEELRISYPPRSKQGFTIFMTGLSGAGKSTITNALAVKLMELQDRPVSILDGDEVRKYLSSELGFSKEHRALNVRRVGYVASEISKNGGIALCALIAPYRQDRDHNRARISAQGGYMEIHVATPLDVCEGRDVKGLYALARQGKVKQFTGISDPYEEPLSPELTIDTTQLSVEQALDLIIEYLHQEHFIA